MPEPHTPPPEEIPDVADELAPVVNDPGGAHAKGYSADPLVQPTARQEPIPLAEDAGPRERNRN